MINIFDCHCDTLTKAMHSSQNLYKNNLHLDIERLSKYSRAVQIFAIWLDDMYLKNAFENTDRAIDFFEEQLNTYSDFITNDMSCEDKVRGILSIEGGEAIEGSLDKLYHFYERGVRLITLTWNNKNEIGCGAMSGLDEGLTDFGKAVVKEMNSMNMVVDVSHLNENGFFDVCDICEKPFAATHSNAAAVCSHPRNLTDVQLRTMSERGCIVGVNLYPVFVDGERGSLSSIMRHIDHIMNIMGEDNVAIGCDYDGISICPENMEDVSCLPVMYDEIKRIWGSKIADKIFYENMLKFWL